MFVEIFFTATFFSGHITNRYIPTSFYLNEYDEVCVHMVW